MGATIAVDLDTLPGIISSLQAVRDDIATQKTSLTTQHTALQEAITGSAPIIGTFEDSILAAGSAFDSLDATLDHFIMQLGKVQSDASDAISSLSQGKL